MKLDIREAVSTDMEGLLGLYSQLGMDDGRVLPLEIAGLIFERIKSYPDYHIYLAEADGEIVGTFALLIMDNLGHMGTPSAILEDVVVAEDFRGKGIGERMMEYATELCRQKGCYKFTFSSNINRTDAHRFYENLGFEKHGYSFFLNLEQGEEC